MSEKEKEPMFSAKIWKLLTSPFNQSNPITVQILGICSALAVTAKLKPAFVMALSVIVVTAFSSLIISMIRIREGNSGRSGAEGLCVRCKQAVVCVRGIDYYQLYHHGAYRGVRARE